MSSLVVLVIDAVVDIAGDVQVGAAALVGDADGGAGVVGVVCAGVADGVFCVADVDMCTADGLCCC